VNNIVARIDEPDQTVVVLVEDDYVALQVFFHYPPKQPDAVVLLGADGAGRLGSAVILAGTHVREAS
jgi:hypothetical protein